VTLDEKITFFFAVPAPIQTFGTFSSLHLLRREVQDCLIGKVIDEDQVITEAMQGEHRLFATMMVVMAGVDVLAKFYAGSDNIGQVGARIKGFAARYMFTSAQDPERAAEGPVPRSQESAVALVHAMWPATGDLAGQPTIAGGCRAESGESKPFSRGHRGRLPGVHQGAQRLSCRVGDQCRLRNKFESMSEKCRRTGFGVMPDQSAPTAIPSGRQRSVLAAIELHDLTNTSLVEWPYSI
jgi:hypothetical protein